MKFLLVFLLTIGLINAKSISEKYSIEFGVLGEVATVSANLKTKKQYYQIEANLTIIGAIAKKVTENLKERHISKGHISKGKYITDMYQMIKSYGKINSTTIYKSNHKTKRVTRQYKEWKQGKLVVNKTVKLKYYATHDLVNIFLNIAQFNKHRKGKIYVKKVVGADRKNGSVSFSIPTDKESKKMQGILGKKKKGEWYSKLIMQRKVYHSKKGELELKMGRDGMLEKAVLKDLIFFGDIRILRQ